jgi:nicotinamidase-related amidase
MEAQTAMRVFRQSVCRKREADAPRAMSSQPGNKNDLDGNAPDTHPTALLLVDVINDFEFPGGDKLLDVAMRVAPQLKELKRRARLAGVPVIYANDNFGRWRSKFEDLLERCAEQGRKSRPFVEQIAPDSQDYAVLKPKHSAFYQTPLDVLLKNLGTRRLIVAGFCTNSCVQFTANDAYMRDLEILVPSDCAASQQPEDHESALRHMKTVIKANISPAAQLDF